MEKNDIFLNFLSIFFGEYNKEEAQELALFCGPRETKKGEILFREGESGHLCYFLHEGMVRLSKMNEEGKEVTLHIVHHGELFAEALFHLDFRYPVTAFVLKEARLLTIDTKKMFRYIEKNPPFAMRFIAQLVRRLKDLTRKWEEFTLMNQEERLLNYLHSLSGKQNSREITLEIPKRETAMLLGTTPESLSRLLGRLEREGVLKVKGRVVELKATSKKPL